MLWRLENNLNLFMENYVYLTAYVVDLKEAIGCQLRVKCVITKVCNLD